MQADLLYRPSTRKVLRPHQVRAIDMVRSSLGQGNRRVVLQGPVGFGKCLGRGTPVVMANGDLVPVQDIRVGDRLASPTGDPVTVLSLARGREQMFRINPVKGDSWVCNASHLLSVKMTATGHRIRFADGQIANGEKGEIVTITAADLFSSSKTARLSVKQWRPEVVCFDGVSSLLIPPYAFGVWLGDGTAKSPGVSKPFSAVTDAWVEYVESVGCNIRVSHGSTGCPTFHASTQRGLANPVLDRLRDLGVLGRKHIPSAYKTSSVRDRLRLLAGIFDTDGYTSNGGIDFISASRELAEDVAFVCRSVGFAAYVRECRKGIASTGFEGTYWRVGVSGDLSGIPARRLKITPRKQIKDHRVTGFTMEPIGEGDYYGFEISGDRLFLLGDFTVTHNTLVSASIIEMALAKGNRAIFTAPMISLIDQTVAAFEAEGIHDIGVMQSSHPRTNPLARVQVASVQTLRTREIPKASLVIVDECHIQDKTILRLMSERSDAFFIGLTATPWAKGMGHVWQDLVIPCTTASLIDDGFLSQFTVFAPDVPDLSRVRVERGDYAEAQLSALMGDAKLVGNVVTTWLEKAAGRPTLVFGVDRGHAEGLQAAFMAAGVAAGYVDGTYDRVARGVISRRFRNGELQVICSVRTMTTGVDLPVSCICDCAPTRSRMLHVQKIGRGLRINPGTEDLLVLDHAGNSLRLGLVSEIHQDKLDITEKGRKQEREPAAGKLPKPCVSCGVLHTGAVCPSCGHERRRTSGVESAEGELVEVTKSKTKPADKQKFWSMALWLDDSRGKGGRLAKGLYKGKFGVWPSGLESSRVAPDAEFMGYEKASRIRYAKRMAAK